jgi:hypothetical protein
MLNLRIVFALILAASLIGSSRAQNAGAQDVPSDTNTVASAPSPVTPNEPLAADARDTDNPLDSGEWKARVAAARQRHEDWLACIAVRGPNCSPSSAFDPMQALLNDETLVSGDIVSTPKGLKVFRGQPEIPHSLSDFK